MIDLMETLEALRTDESITLSRDSAGSIFATLRNDGRLDPVDFRITGEAIRLTAGHATALADLFAASLKYALKEFRR